jgi:hypothetical protein
VALPYTAPTTGTANAAVANPPWTAAFIGTPTTGQHVQINAAGDGVEMATAQQGGYADSAKALVTQTDVQAQADIGGLFVVSLTTPQVEEYPEIFLRASSLGAGGTYVADGYGLVVAYNGQLQLDRVVGSAKTTLVATSAGTAFTWTGTGDHKIYVRFEVTGSGGTVTLNGKAWGFAAGLGAEPGSWIVTYADTDAARITAGNKAAFVVGGGNSAANKYFQIHSAQYYAVAAGTAWAQTMTDSLGATDSQVLRRDVTVAFTEAEGLTDSFAQVFNEKKYSFTDSLGSVDGAVPSLSTSATDYARTFSEPIGMSDAVSSQLDIPRTMGPDAVGISDSISAVLVSARTAGDAIGLTDSVSSSLALARSFGGASTPTGVVSKASTKVPFTSSSTPTGSIARANTKTRTGSSTPTGSVTKFSGRSFSGSSIATGLQGARSFTKLLSGSVTAHGFTNFLGSSSIFAGTSTPTGTVRRSTTKSASGTSTPTGATTKLSPRGFSSTSTPFGGIIKSLTKTFTGSSQAQASMIRGAGLIVSGFSTPTSTLIKKTFKSFASSSTPTATTSKQVAGQVFGGSVHATGVLTKIAQRQNTAGGSVTPGGSLARTVIYRSTGSSLATGALTKLFSTAAGGNSHPTGVIQKNWTRSVAGNAAVFGTIIQQFISGFHPPLPGTAQIVIFSADEVDLRFEQ